MEKLIARTSELKMKACKLDAALGMSCLLLSEYELLSAAFQTSLCAAHEVCG